MENIYFELQKFEKLTEKGKKRIPAICDAAAQIFSEKGYLTSTLWDIAQAAGITKGGIFHYFSTKEELLFGELPLVPIGMKTTSLKKECSKAGGKMALIGLVE